MVYIICAVRDTALAAFNRPFTVQSTGVAIRSFSDEVNRNAEDNMMFSHPEHFSLYKLGEWNDESGDFATHLPELLISADNAKLPG